MTKRSFLYVSLICLAGCASAPYKPTGFTEQQAESKLNDLRQFCRHLPMGAYINIQFYEGAVDAGKQTMTPLTGYFYSYNKMNDMISIADKPLTVMERGVPYDLRRVSEITLAQQVAQAPAEPNIVMKAVKNFFHPGPNDPTRQLLTQ